MLILVCIGDLWVNKVSVSFLQQLDFKNEKQNIGTVILIRQ